MNNLNNVGEKEAVMMTMSEASFDRIEERHERREKRYILALIIALALIFATNALWLYAWLQYDYVVESVTVESSDNAPANYIGNDGDIYNGKDSSTENN
jgi:hypothetical protein